MASLGVHLVGSVSGVDTALASFKRCSTAFPSRLRRIPDGEPGHRSGFIAWQRDVFNHTPSVFRQWDYPSFKEVVQPPIPDSEVERIVSSTPTLKPGYLDAAMESYAVFKQLKEDGTIAPGTRFQVCLPTPICVMVFMRDDRFKAAVEPIYERALLDDVKEMQRRIPHSDLAIQWDFACEPVTLEGAPMFESYFEPVFEGIMERTVRLVEAVHPDVEVGVHMCYGDMFNKHIMEPTDTGLMVKCAKELLRSSERKVNWLHMPVPKERDDDAYFAPLKDLDLGDTELYLGLIHGYEEEQTMKRIEAAKKVVPKFGVATECGLGRTPDEKFDSIAKISTMCSQAVV